LREKGKLVVSTAFFPICITKAHVLGQDMKYVTLSYETGLQTNML